MIYNDYKRGLKWESTFETVVATFGKQVPFRPVVFNWYSKFKRGRASFQDETQAGAPVAALHLRTLKLWGTWSRPMPESPLTKIQKTWYCTSCNKFHLSQKSWCAEVMCTMGAAWSDGCSNEGQSRLMSVHAGKKSVLDNQNPNGISLQVMKPGSTKQTLKESNSLLYGCFQVDPRW